MKNNVSRRSVVAGVGAIGIAAGLAACGEGNEGNEGAEDGAVQPTTAATGNTNSRVIAAVSDVPVDRKSTRLNSSHSQQSRMPSSA